MPDTDMSKMQWVDIPFDSEHPIAFGINVYPNKTRCHYDIHVGMEMGIVLSGKGRRWFGDYSYPVRKGQIWFAGLWEPHGFEITQPPARHMVIEIVPEFLDTPEPFTSFDWLKLFEVSPDRRPTGSKEYDRNFAIEQADNLMKVIRGKKTYNWLIRTRLILQEFLLHFTEQIDESSKSKSRVEPFGQRRKLLPALMLLEKNRCQNVTITSASREAHMSRSSFSQMFRSAMGVSFGKYCQRRRLAGAICDLRSTDLKLAAIAYHWGFCDAAHFVRQFKSTMHMTPNEYRVYWNNPERKKQLLQELPIPTLNLPMHQE